METEKYVRTELKITEFDVEDVITTSGAENYNLREYEIHMFF